MIKRIKNKLLRMLTRDAIINLNKFSYNDPDRICNLKNFQQKYRFSILPIAYFEPVPDLREIDLKDTSTSEILLDLETKYDFAFIEKNFNIILHDKIIPEWLQENPMFPVFDMAAYGSIIERYKPSKIIEIGAGYSTCFSSLFKNFLKLNTKITAIEPFPAKHLLDLEKENKVKLIKKKIQVIDEPDIKEICELKENDILFIDTSHISNLGSDTNFIFIKLLPKLQKGVIIHIHDIYLPYDYSRAVYYERGTFYNEQYLLASILANSNNYTPLYSSNEVYIKKYSLLPKKDDSRVKLDKMRSGGSFWMQKLN